MTYDVRLARGAANYIARLDRPTADRIVRRLDEIAADPFGPHTKLLTNAAGKRSSRVGNYRIVFSVDLVATVIDVSVVAPRGRAYRDV